MIVRCAKRPLDLPAALASPPRSWSRARTTPRQTRSGPTAGMPPVHPTLLPRSRQCRSGCLQPPYPILSGCIPLTDDLRPQIVSASKSVVHRRYCITLIVLHRYDNILKNKVVFAFDAIGNLAKQFREVTISECEMIALISKGVWILHRRHFRFGSPLCLPLATRVNILLILLNLTLPALVRGRIIRKSILFRLDRPSLLRRKLFYRIADLLRSELSRIELVAVRIMPVRAI